MRMEGISQWLIGVCMACAAAGLLERLCDTRQKKSVIKLVLTLYILVSVFPSTWQKADWEFSWDASALPESAATYDPYQSAAQQAGQQLSEQYSEKYGVPVEVRVQVQEDHALVQSVEVTADEAFDEIRKALQTELGEQVPITQVQGGTQDEANGTTAVG